MEPYRFRVFVCRNVKEDGKSSCTLRGSCETFSALKEELAKRELQFDVKVVQSGCLDLCDRGPNAIVYPEGVWYSGLTREHIPAFVECQLVKGKKYQEKACNEAELKNFFEKRKARKKEEAHKLLNNSNASRSS